MNGRERAKFILEDIKINHLPRLQESIDSGYPDENQVLVIYDHMIRARILIEEEGK